MSDDTIMECSLYNQSVLLLNTPTLGPDASLSSSSSNFCSSSSSSVNAIYTYDAIITLAVMTAQTPLHASGNSLCEKTKDWHIKNTTKGNVNMRVVAIPSLRATSLFCSCKRLSFWWWNVIVDRKREKSGCE